MTVVRSNHRAHRRVLGSLLAIAVLVMPPVLAPRGQTSQTADDLAKTARVIADKFTATFHAGLAEILKDGTLSALDDYLEKVTDAGTVAMEDTTFDLALVSAKPRAPEHAPDAWELAALEGFAAKRVAGVDATKLDQSTLTVTSEGLKIFRYIRPIVAEAQCLACHGKDIADDVKAELAREYPEDKATGYALGDIMGALSMVRPIE